MASEDNPGETERSQAESVSTERKPAKRPFDTSDMNWIPNLKEGDPPYRDWWVVDQEKTDE